MGATKWLLAAGVVLALACTGDSPNGPPDLASTAVEPVVVLAAGDIAGSSSSYHHEETSAGRWCFPWGTTSIPMV